MLKFVKRAENELLKKFEKEMFDRMEYDVKRYAEGTKVEITGEFLKKAYFTMADIFYKMKIEPTEEFWEKVEEVVNFNPYEVRQIYVYSKLIKFPISSYNNILKETLTTMAEKYEKDRKIGMAEGIRKMIEKIK
jgi:hypothetical protein